MKEDQGGGVTVKALLSVPWEVLQAVSEAEVQGESREQETLTSQREAGKARRAPEVPGSAITRCLELSSRAVSVRSIVRFSGFRPTVDAATKGEEHEARLAAFLPYNKEHRAQRLVTQF